MNKSVIDKAINHDIFNFDKISTENITNEFILYYHKCLIDFITLENQIDKSNVYDFIFGNYISNLFTTKRTLSFLDWFECDGIKSFDYVLQNIKIKEINENARSFTKLYSYLLNKSISSRNLDSLVDYLYYIPGVMKRDYEKFGFVNDKLENISLNVDCNEYSNYNFKAKVKESAQQIPCFA